MRDVKIVAYGSVSEEDLLIITDNLKVTMATVTVFSVDPLNEDINRKARVISDQNEALAAQAERIEYLEGNLIEGFIDKDALEP